MPRSRPETLRQALAEAAPEPGRRLTDGKRSIEFADVLGAGCLAGRLDQLLGKSVLLAAGSQFEAALALIDLDGCARRIVLLPPDARAAQIPAIVRDAEVDAVVCSDPASFETLCLPAYRINLDLERRTTASVPAIGSEWVLLTSGTTGDPKLAIHSLRGLAAAIPSPDADSARVVWATFYDIRRYGGLQIFLRAMFGRTTLVLSDADETPGDFVARLAGASVTHVSGTPSHWRRLLMMGNWAGFAPAYIRLSGEIADQVVLDGLHAAFPKAAIGHAYASTEAGVGFDVCDMLEGFPHAYLDAPRNGVELRIADGSLCLRSPRRALAYAGRPDLRIADAEGWVDSGDMVETRDGRCYFIGRRSGVINVGGLKVHPEEVEQVIGRHQAVQQARVRARRSPIVGSIVVADVVLRNGSGESGSITREIMETCAASLPAHKVPALISIVAAIELTEGGKVARPHA